MGSRSTSSSSSEGEPLVLFPAQIGDDGRRLAGGKGAELARLALLGLRVPPFFCVTVRAFDLFLEGADPRGRLRTELAGVHPEDRPRIERLARRARDAMGHAEFPKDVREAVLGARGRLGRGKRLAVRSSALAEDLETASFAGQYDTVLDVAGQAHLLRALRRCWTSAFNPWAVEYRLRSGSEETGFAVVVQEMVRAESAGVAFTSHPVHGGTDEVVIEACRGLGETVVSGRDVADEYAVPKEGGGPVRVRVAEKREAWLPGEGGGAAFRKVRLKGRDRRRRALTDGQARRIARLARRIEEVHGSARDIEWAIEGGRVFVLQNRPVTHSSRRDRTPGPAPDLDTPIPARFPVYSNGNISEVLPGLVSPLTWSLAGPGLEYAFRRPCIEMGLVDEARDLAEPWVVMGFFRHRPYLNVSFFRHVAEKAPGLSPDAVDEEFMGRRPERAGVLDPSILDPRLWPRLARMLLVAGTKPRRIALDVEAARRRIGQEKRRIEEGQPRSLSIRELVERVQPRLEGLDLLATHIWASEFAVVWFGLLRRFTRMFLGDEEGALAARLVTGLADMSSATPSLDLWRLSREVASSKGLRRLFERHGPRETWRALSRAREGTPQAKLFRSIDRFLDVHGHRGVLETELRNPTWREDPSYVLSILGNYARARPTQDPALLVGRQRRERERAEADAMAGLAPGLGPIFRGIVRAARTYILRREEVKSLLVEAGSLARPYFHELSRKLVRSGHLAILDDLYFLTIEEVGRVGRGEIDAAGTRSIVRRRRLDFEWSRRIELPGVIEGKPVPLHVEMRAVTGDERLTGMGVSPGRASGRARVILDPRTEQTIEQGEILVAPVTDAGWAPLFLSAAGLVVDIGGLLSHGSIVAREYGIPAVVNVRRATRLIRTGDWVTMDGGTGEVWLEHQGEGPAAASPCPGDASLLAPPIRRP